MLAVIPYLEQPVFDLLGMRVQLWDLFVVAGFLSGAWVAMKAAQKIGLDGNVILDYSPQVLLAGFTGAHLVHVFAYEPHLLSENPWFILQIWSGLSSFGGFLGAAILTVWFFRSRNVNFWRYETPLSLGLTWGWLVARVGCFFAHDHKGSLSEFPLAVDFPGGARHDLGLYDAILSFFLLMILVVLWKRRPRFGVMGGVTCVVYAVARFFLDNLRSVDLANSDARYLGLTPAQFGCFALAGLGIWMLWRSRQEPVIGQTPPG